MKKDMFIVIWDDSIMKGQPSSVIINAWKSNSLKEYKENSSIELFEGEEMSVRYHIMEKILENESPKEPRVLQVQSIHDR